MVTCAKDIGPSDLSDIGIFFFVCLKSAFRQKKFKERVEIRVNCFTHGYVTFELTFNIV